MLHVAHTDRPANVYYSQMLVAANEKHYDRASEFLG